MFHYKFIVTSNSSVDCGSFTGHDLKSDAVKCAKQVGGYVWKLKKKDNGSIIFKPVDQS